MKTKSKGMNEPIKFWYQIYVDGDWTDCGRFTFYNHKGNKRKKSTYDKFFVVTNQVIL